MPNSLLSPLSFTSWFDAATGDVIQVDVYFYNAGTTTEADVFSDGLLQYVHDQPVRTGGSGRLPPVFVSETPSLYRIRVYDVDGVLLEDIDNLPGAQPDADSVPPPLDLDYDGFLQVGDIVARFGTPIARDGFALCNGGTIGSDASTATELTGNAALLLFTWLWEQDQAGALSLTISGGAGANAGADWAANKTITLPDLRGRVIAGLDGMGESAAGRLGTTYFGSNALNSGLVGGVESIALSVGHLAQHQHTVGDGSGYWINTTLRAPGGEVYGVTNVPGSGGALSFVGQSIVTGHATPTYTGLYPEAAAVAHQNMQPTMTLCFYIRAPVYVP